ncbi:MAG: amidase domain-containing protein [Amnibacterium sp.]
MPTFRTVSAVTAVAIGLTVLAGAPAFADDAPSPEPTPAPTTTPSPAPIPDPAPVPEPAATRLAYSSGHSASSRVMHVYGTGLTGLAEVLVDGVATDGLTVLDDSTATFLLDVAPDYQPGTVSISLLSDDGTIVPTTLTFRYSATNRRDKQMAYAFAHWNDTTSARYGYIPDNDCADFASQTLAARGWRQSSQWYDRGAAARTKRPVASAPWISSTAMSTWLRSRPDLATHLSWARAQRVQAVVGDVVQFDWDSKKYPGVWQHTGIVSKVVALPNGDHAISYVAHTNNNRWGDVTWLVQHYKNLRVQFWHLKQ